mgnify:FL=1|tara:strand:- start:52 stop:285 length:234 start_codon:yes stop_codon:yes gene_type:complete
MLKYQCNNCEIQKELSKVTMKVIDGKVVNLGTECPECGEYMQEIEKAFGGFPSLKRTEPTLSNRKDKMWGGVKDRLN